MQLNWADPGFNVVPIVIPFNDITGNPVNSENPLMEPIYLANNGLTRTSAKFVMREAIGRVQVIRLWVLLYRNDFNIALSPIPV